jgi:hypothetical protein
MSLWVVAELLAGAGAEYYTPRVFMFGAWASIRFIWMLYRGRDDVFFLFFGCIFMIRCLWRYALTQGFLLHEIPCVGMYGVNTGRKPVLLHEMLLLLDCFPLILVQSWIVVQVTCQTKIP